MLNEEQGCAVLLECFTQAGLQIVPRYPYTLGDLHLELDGYDPVRKVGYEYITTEAGDRVNLGPEVVASLTVQMERGELALLLVDELDVESAEELKTAAARFLAAFAPPSPEERR